ncbi:hypothetical protein HYH02_005912 [Chlamydomonas schloesseri]|uniref:Uncharacterized protein n=1 Tax=Chlamydomonas schloesseri TaxID=2026947 RepID=A0A836B6R8_9CHLO|nr:hypothetical protein HYH02_005912 [Chlamydomonas schloesseri]|eukprot:KAG2449165.1 hypothetical protein HYH02_005912 [Chlamydomonas schloesseri]
MRAAAPAVLAAAALLLLLLAPTAHATDSPSYDDSKRRWPAEPYPPTISVAGVDVLNPRDVQQYRQAHVTYWRHVGVTVNGVGAWLGVFNRTVMSKPADASPANPAPVSPPANFACPKATAYDWPYEYEEDAGKGSKDRKGGKDSKGKDNKKKPKKPQGEDTFLITGSLLAAPGTINRSCSLPARRRVILNVLDDVEWYAPTIDYTQSSPQLVPQGVRLSPSSLRSLAQVNIELANASSCVFLSINGTQVPNITSFFHVSPYVPDMDIAPGFFQVVRQVNNINVTGDKAAQELLRKGKNNTDFADAGYYLIFPRGLPIGRHTLRFGLRAGCSLAAGRTFFREGVRYSPAERGCGDDRKWDDDGKKERDRKGGDREEGERKEPAGRKEEPGRKGEAGKWDAAGCKDDGKGECWPYPNTCGTDCVTLGAAELPAFGWEYVITVTDKQ